ncbi:type II toxin-antitoxin system death-on-curing family toxin [Candidatus Regiella endosymbiont of Tuberolachnus salignus]|uniref:type II toxin-antitoxin system death-on-curing family toxin n=1 Tax=Candidatus Regiella endosymbiont of Tuberolachnus salignus TaxID=3077956 RepID=UPI0030D4723A
MEEIVLLSIEQVINIQKNTLPQGAVVDYNKLVGALNRIQNRQHYENCNGKFELAALYLTAIAKAHAFVDANKRTAFISCATFLRANGIQLQEMTFYLTKLTVMVATDKVTEKETAILLALLSDYYTQFTDYQCEFTDEEECIYYNLAIAMVLNGNNIKKLKMMAETVKKLLDDGELNVITKQILERY